MNNASKKEGAFAIPAEGANLLTEIGRLTLHLAPDGLLQVINQQGETEAGIFLMESDLDALADIFDPARPRFEIERRWLVDPANAPNLSQIKLSYPKFKAIRSGILAFDAEAQLAARVRLIGERYLLDLKAGSGISRRESRAIKLSPLTGASLLDLCGERVVDKLRFDLDLFELDCFISVRGRPLVDAQERLSVLHVEREFESLEEAQTCAAPQVFGHTPREITDDSRRNNLAYALFGPPSD
ncbi:MAG: hypothetical protein K1X83_15625 [Oligoflexia bacterium]|nr:hypothetical protein [Oligoflexia bacterium]